jgi:hypothetical protein
MSLVTRPACVSERVILNVRWAGYVVKLFDNRIQKRILEGSIGGRRPAGKPKDTTEGDVRKDEAILLKTETYCAAAKHESAWRKNTADANARKRIKRRRKEKRRKKKNKITALFIYS